MLQNTTLIDALLPFVQCVVLVFVLLLWSLIIPFIIFFFLFWYGLLHNWSFVKGSHYFSSLWSSSAWNEPLNFLFEHADLAVIPFCSFNQEPSLCGSWEVTSFFSSEGKLFLTCILFLLVFNCVLRAKKATTITGSYVTAAGSLNSGFKFNFGWLCWLLCLGLDYFPLTFRGLGDL